ncbi:MULTISPECIES: prolyl oligopeptidase family serine peptidase [unclassified Brachybacterium]|uniref:prolyl oligopeptidase family serine peptidase n=1 Tax=unclassified Brachybacterium TaxID=2623841 RepID=UPI00403404FE
MIATAAAAAPALDRTVATPLPIRRSESRTVHGDTAVTSYGWLRDQRAPETVTHLAAENAYTDQRTAHLEGRRSTLLQELTDTDRDLDLSAPVRSGGWWYIDRPSTGAGSSADASLSRVRAAAPGPGTVPDILDGVPLEGEEVLIQDRQLVVGIALSSDHDLLARAEVSAGGCDITVVDLSTGEVVDHAVQQAGPDLAFSQDSRWIFYTQLDDIGRRHQVRRHRLGTPAAADETVLTEPDHWAELSMARSRDLSTLLISSVSTTTSETWMLDLDDPTGAAVSVTGRHHGVHQVIEHAGDRLLAIRQGEVGGSVLSVAPLADSDGLADSTILLTAAEGEQFDAVEAFAGFAALQVRSGGLPGVWILPRRSDGSFDVAALRTVDHGGELDALHLDANPSWTQHTLRYRLDSLRTPATIAQLDVGTGEIEVLRRAAAPGIDPGQYLERRLWATSADGTQVPISLLARHDATTDGTAPGILYGDGAFGISNDPRLLPGALALADLGLVVAVAHVRGGGEMGRDWHRRGRLLHKANSFDDFVACADHLVSQGWVAPDRLGALGQGSGGLLVAASANRAPGRFRAIVAGAPLVDPLETLLDPEVMLTLEEWAEWGDPAGDEQIYRRLRSYSPAENIRATEYPAVFAWTSLEDQEVLAAEAAIWVAALRARVTSDPQERPVLLRCVPTAADASALQAESMAWLLDQLEVPEAAR